MHQMKQTVGRASITPFVATFIYCLNECDMNASLAVDQSVCYTFLILCVTYNPVSEIKSLFECWLS